jgi:alkanesulfonate monooxygenase SsuD/methylene tetrahydromethanopterin reductase-like flavin-dependent oxidoreductase (luciferase family)
MLVEKVARASRHPWVANGQVKVRFGVVGGPMGDWPALRDFVQMVEGLGFDSYWRADHPLLTPDCWTTLAAVAASTQRLRLGSMVTCVLYRNPVLLARIVADVDRISQGRVILGLGAGDMEPEFRAMGLAYPPVRERQDALAEALQVVPRLLRGETVSSFQGTHCRIEGVTLQPPPVQQPYVPLVVAGGGKRTTLRLVAQYADASNLAAEGWGGAAATDADVRQKYEALQAHCAALGRPYASVLRTYHFVPTLLADSPAALAVKRERAAQLLTFAGAGALLGTPEQAAERVRPLVGAGCQYFTFAVFDPDTLRLLAERVVPAVIRAASAA